MAVFTFISFRDMRFVLTAMFSVLVIYGKMAGIRFSFFGVYYLACMVMKRMMKEIDTDRARSVNRQHQRGHQTPNA